ncbi:hypothetical protein [Pedobacter sp.]
MTRNINRIIKVAVLAVVISFIAYLAYMFFAFDLFETDNDKLKVIDVSGRPYKIVLYRINGNATVQSGIQVRKLDGENESTLKHYDRYDSLISYSVFKGSLELVLKNTNFQKQKPDTLYLKLP